MEKYLNILRQYWHYDDFRPLQAEIIAGVGSGKDTLALMPTGGGKSLCFQVPAMTMSDPCDPEHEGLCLVITPLVALMRDQVDNLRKRDIKAAAIYTGLSPHEIAVTLDNCQFGNYKFLYVSPERLESRDFRKRLTELPICLIAVDEAHCISQWGYDFRPPYLRIASIREVLNERLRLHHVSAHIPILALTATATPDVVEDIQDKLGFKERNVLQKSFARDNLSYVVRHVDEATANGNAWEAKLLQLLHILQHVPGTSVVYVRNRQKTHEVADWLTAQNVPSAAYHAGLNRSDKESRQAAWKEGSIRVMVATNAFGMGIDKADVRTVIHLDLPDTLEAYFQEAGRAGRDGEPAYAVLLYHKEDKQKALKRIQDNYPDLNFILRVYDLMGNFLQVGIASGLDHIFAFPLEQFCAQCHLPLLPTYSALQILTQAGYITYLDEQETQARVMMAVTTEELYHTNLTPEEERLVQMLLRRYTGIFTEPAYIHDERLSSDMGMNKQGLHQLLIGLAGQGIIRYIPRRKTPYVVYSQERLQLEYVKIPASCLDERQVRYEDKIQAMIEYAEQQLFCRSQLLLSYFGETHSPVCGTCDVCRKNKSASHD